MTFHSIQNILLLSLLGCAVAGISNFKRFDDATKLIAILVSLGCATELSAYYSAKLFHTNLVVYSAYSFLEYCLYCRYFGYLHAYPNTKQAFLTLCGLGAAVWSVDTAILSKFATVNALFLFYEGIVVIALCFRSLVYWQKQEDLTEMNKNPHFWFVCIWLFFWSLTYLSWGLNYYFNERKGNYGPILNFSLVSVNILIYLSIAIVFMRFRKMQQLHE